MILLAIDPGPEFSAYVIWCGEKIQRFGKVTNDELLTAIKAGGNIDLCVIEQVASFGMPVGAEVFETVFWSGRFAEAFGVKKVRRLKRHEVKMHLCHNMKAKDGNIRQALIDRFGGPGCIRKGGLLYKISGDCWSALAVGITMLDQSVSAI